MIGYARSKVRRLSNEPIAAIGAPNVKPSAVRVPICPADFEIPPLPATIVPFMFLCLTSSQIGAAA